MTYIFLSENQHFRAYRTELYSCIRLAHLNKLNNMQFERNLIFFLSLSIKPLFRTKTFLLFQPIATAFDFNTSEDMTLWKDRTAIEMTAAVLYSFKVSKICHYCRCSLISSRNPIFHRVVSCRII